jgi:hypothetical protein
LLGSVLTEREVAPRHQSRRPLAVLLAFPAVFLLTWLAWRLYQ